MVKKVLTAAQQLFVAINSLAALVAFLGFNRQRRDWPCFQPLDRDWIAGLFAEAVGALFDPLQRRVDLRDQLVLAVAGPKLDSPVGLRRCAVGNVGVILVLILKMLEGFFRLLEDVVPPVEQLDAEILPLAVAHEGLFVRWTIKPLHWRRRLSVATAVAGAVAVFHGLAVGLTVLAFD